MVARTKSAVRAGTQPDTTASLAGPPAATRFDIIVLQRRGTTEGRAQGLGAWAFVCAGDLYPVEVDQ